MTHAFIFHGTTGVSAAHATSRHQRVLAALMASLMMAAAIAQPAWSGTPATIALLVAASPATSALPADLIEYPEVQHYLQQNLPTQALAALQLRLALHENDPRYFNLSGAIALKIPDYAAAASAFERVVVMQPENAGAWVDLAIASAELGNNASALAYFEHVEAEFQPPAELRVIIARYRARIASRTRIKSPWTTQVQTSVGVDTNANSGLQNSIIALNFGAERIDFVLDPNYRARSDMYGQVGADTAYQQQVGGNLLEFGAGIRKRQYRHERDFSTLDGSLSAGLQRPTVLGDAALRLHLEHLSLGDRSLLNNLRAVVQLERPQGDCRIGVGAEGAWRRYAGTTTLDANLIWGQAGIACDWKPGYWIAQTTLIGRIGRDSPIGNRAGGSTRRAEVIAQISVPLPLGARAEVSTTLSLARDADGYSALLEQNAVRRLDRSNLRVVMTRPIGLASDVFLLVEDNRFRSNLALFVQSGQSLSVGLRHRF